MFVQKTKEEMDIILQSNVDVLKYNDVVYILKSYNQFEKVVFKDINKGEETVSLKLSFCREPHEKSRVNYIPFIYQESSNLENNKFMVYDMVKNRIEVSMSNNPALNCQKYLYEEDDQPFNVFKISRTSDCHYGKDKGVPF